MRSSKIKLKIKSQQKQLSLALALSLVISSVAINTHAASDDSGKWYNPTSWFEANKTETTVQTTDAETTQIAKASWWDKLRGKKDNSEESTTKTEQTQTAPAEQPKQPDVKEKAANHDKKEEVIGAVLETQRGKIVVELYEKDAPITVKNFKELISKKFYDSPGMKFHRVIPGFVIQTGDPTGTGYGGSDETIPLEVDNKLSHDAEGVLAMARGPRPNSASSQFYITLAPQKHLDGKYAVFGHVISGLEVLSKIQKDDMLYGVKLIDISDVERETNEKSSKSLFSFFRKS